MKMIFAISLAFLVPSSLVSALVAHSKIELPNFKPTVTTVTTTPWANTAAFLRLNVTAGSLRCTMSTDNWEVQTGCLMYTNIPVNQRWPNTGQYQDTFRRHTAQNLVCVRYRHGVWQYDTFWDKETDRPQKTNNGSWHYFTVRPDDFCVAQINYHTRSMKSLLGKKYKYKGMSMGYKTGDMKVSLYRNKFEVKGKGIFPWPDIFGYVPTVPPPPAPVLPANRYQASTGVFRCTDRATGKAFVMYTQKFVNDRWNVDKSQADFRMHTAKNFVCIRYKDQKWQYDSNWKVEKDRNSHNSWHDFKPEATDVVIATVDYATKRVKDLKGINFRHSGLQMGYGAGDIQLFMNQDYDAKRAPGMWRMTGSWILSWDAKPPPAQIPHPGIVTEEVKTVNPGNRLGLHRFTCHDSTSDHGFIMFTPKPLAARLAQETKDIKKGGPTSADLRRAMKRSFVCVRFYNHRWQFDSYWRNSKTWHTFIPNITDVLVAAVDYRTGLITSTQGTNVKYSGMQMGYAGGDIVVSAYPRARKKEWRFDVLGKTLLAYTNTSSALSPPKPWDAKHGLTTTTEAPKVTTTSVVPFFTTTETTTVKPVLAARPVVLAAKASDEDSSQGEDDIYESAE